MPISYSICFNKPGDYQLPCDINNQLTVEKFRRDNRHIMANFIPNGVPFVVRGNYILEDESSINWQRLHPDLAVHLRKLRCLTTEQRINIATLLHTYGSPMLNALSEFYDKGIKPFTAANLDPRIPSTGNTYAGAIVGVTESRLLKFTEYLTEYQNALENVRKGALAKLPKLQMDKLKQTARVLHKMLNSKFHSELSKYFSPGKASKGTPWTNSENGINRAVSGRSYKAIDPLSESGFVRIKNLAGMAKWIGRGALVVDAGFRADRVLDKYKMGGNWQRSLAIETTSFGTAGLGAIGGGAAGVATAEAGLALLSAVEIVLAPTPIGWVLIIGVGLIGGVMGAGFGDVLGRKISSGLYDGGFAHPEMYSDMRELSHSFYQ